MYKIGGWARASRSGVRWRCLPVEQRSNQWKTDSRSIAPSAGVSGLVPPRNTGCAFQPAMTAHQDSLRKRFPQDLSASNLLRRAIGSFIPG